MSLIKKNDLIRILILHKPAGEPQCGTGTNLQQMMIQSFLPFSFSSPPSLPLPTAGDPHSSLTPSSQSASAFAFPQRSGRQLAHSGGQLACI